MKRVVFILFCMLVSVMGISRDRKQEIKKEITYDYQLESYDGQVAAQPGYSIVKIWCQGPKEDLQMDLYMRYAVHGILFRGYASKTARAADKGKKALVPDGYNSNKDYFDEFFKEDYRQYAQMANNGKVMKGDMMRVSRKEIRMAQIIMVNYDALRKRLEKDGIIKSLDFLF